MKELQELETAIINLVQCFKEFSITFNKNVTQIDKLENMMNRLNREGKQNV
jgi:hypothetical protein